MPSILPQLLLAAVTSTPQLVPSLSPPVLLKGAADARSPLPRLNDSPPGLKLDPSSAETEVDSFDRLAPLWISIASLIGASGVGIVARVAWYDHGTRHFHFIDEGWFGAGTYAGGADKLGHIYSAYISTLIMDSVYRKIGVEPTTATYLAMGFTFLVWNGFEFLGDGFSQYGTSIGDAASNVIGIFVAGMVSIFPQLDRMIGMRVAYVPTHDFLAGDHTPLKLINDYSGMEYFFDLKLKGVLEAFDIDPRFARYFMTGVVYETWKYSPVLDRAQTRRAVGVHLSISLPEILRTWSKEDDGVELIARFFDFFALPFLSVAIVEDVNNNRPYINFGLANRVEAGH
jgi:hypothetical protein